MAADIWLKRDIANALLAAYQSAQETSYAIGGGDPGRAAAFMAGHRAALSTVALFFGIAPGLVMPEMGPAEDTPQLERRNYGR